MGFASEGRGMGSTFFFEVPLYNAAAASVDKSSAAMIESTQVTPSPATIEPAPHRTRHQRRLSLIGRGNHLLSSNGKQHQLQERRHFLCERRHEERRHPVRHPGARGSAHRLGRLWCVEREREGDSEVDDLQRGAAQLQPPLGHWQRSRGLYRVLPPIKYGQEQKR